MDSVGSTIEEILLSPDDLLINTHILSWTFSFSTPWRVKTIHFWGSIPKNPRIYFTTFDTDATKLENSTKFRIHCGWTKDSFFLTCFCAKLGPSARRHRVATYGRRREEFTWESSGNRIIKKLSMVICKNCNLSLGRQNYPIMECFEKSDKIAKSLLEDYKYRE